MKKKLKQNEAQALMRLYLLTPDSREDHKMIVLRNSPRALDYKIVLPR